jgi:hypothetical protein
MENRVIIPLLCAAALAYACGPWTHNSSDTPTASATKANARSNTRTPGALGRSKKVREVATTLDVVPSPTSDGKRVAFALRITNNTTKTVELRFPSGQTHDFVVLDSLGRTVWQWSTGRMFTQAMQSKTVRSSDTLTIEDGWDARNAHGQYVAVATLNTDARTIERRVAFRLP